MQKKTVVIGFFGTTLDARGSGKHRWAVWRPTISVGQHEDLLVSRLDLIIQDRFRDQADKLCSDFRQVSPETETRLHTIPLKDPWDFEEVYAGLLDFAKSYPFDPEHEDYLVHITTGTHVMQICLFLLIESRIIPARILQTGIRDKQDAVGSYSIIDLDLSKYDRLAERFRSEERKGLHYLKSGIETRNAAYNRMIEQLARVCARSDDPVLLTGPSGVGKTRLARLVYEWKKQNHRVTGAFVELNCATLRGDAAMSALFGHRKGAYTGAAEKREGLLSMADGGLLFLDEVGELGADEQAMLLRAIEEKRFYPMGSDEERHSDFQLICGTNRDLNAMVREGKFREDLLSRINLWTFPLMGLKDRPEDIEPNLQYELERASERQGKLIRFNKEAKERFLAMAVSPDALWRSNFRDLSAAVTRLAVLSDSGRITEPLVNEEIARLHRSWSERSEKVETSEDRDMALIKGILGERVSELDYFDIPQLAAVIRVCRESRTLSEAGRKLFSVSLARRQSRNDSDRLRKYLAGFGLDWKKVSER